MAERGENIDRVGTDVTARLQSLRNMLNSERHISAEQQRALDAIDREAADRSAERAIFQQPRTQIGAFPLESSISAFSDPSQIVRTRRRIFRPSERLQRSSDRRERQGRAELLDSIPHSMARLSPRPAAPAEVEEDLNEANVDREGHSRAKRRKLDDGTYEDDSSTVTSYGNLGRMEPGPLKMQIVSCDGGEYYEPNDINTKPEHVLQDDANVYCTKKNKCNILLKHAGGMPFALTKVVFKAPTHGFDAPIQEGLVFISLEDENLVDKASYFDKYSPKPLKHHPRRYDQYRPSHDYLHSTRSPLRTLDRVRQAQEFHSWSRYADLVPELEEPPRMPGFDVTYETPSDTEQDPAPSSPRSWHDTDAGFTFRSFTDRYRPMTSRIERHADLSGSSSGSDDEDTPLYHGIRSERDERELDEAINRQRHVLDRMRDLHARAGGDYHALDLERWHEDESIELNGTSYRTLPREATTHSNSTPHATLAPSHSSKRPAETAFNETSVPENFAPHARFKIRGRSASIAVKFDPPVSGRYVLVKLWAQCPKSNIDIQSIIPHGYGGPRFFPVQDVR